MNPSPTLYRLQPGPKFGEVTMTKVWAQNGPAPLPANFRHLVPLTVGDNVYILGLDSTTGQGSLFQTTSAAPWLAPAKTGIDLGQAFDIVQPFVLGNVPYLLAYDAEQGDFSFFPVSSDLSFQTPFKFRRPHAPGITAGFDMVQPLVINGSVYFMGYSFKTGAVIIYSLSVTSTPMPGAAPGSPPLQALTVWDHTWARNWTRFAFFQLGAENFFLKTNVGKNNKVNNVNIDHVEDDPRQGTVEVGTYLNEKMKDAADIDLVRAFALGGGDPYFVNYIKTGKTMIYRFHSDCQGWTPQATSQTVENATQIVPYRLGDASYLLMY